jgi:hypothetical protein
LDTLEEEFLSIANTIAPHKASKGGLPVEEREEEEPHGSWQAESDGRHSHGEFVRLDLFDWN